jgi:hypothetical protein
MHLTEIGNGNGNGNLNVKDRRHAFAKGVASFTRFTKGSEQ